MKLKNKILISYIFIILFCVIIVGLTFFKYFEEVISDKIMLSIKQSNDQVLISMDNLLENISKLTETPNTQRDIYNILIKNYSGVETYQLYSDIDQVNALLYDRIFFFNDLVDSVLLIPYNMDYFFWKTKGKYLNRDEYETKFQDEEWMNAIMDGAGEEVIIGYREDKIFTKSGDDVITVGRNIVDPYTKESLGVIIINIMCEQLEAIMSKSQITEHSKVFILDGKGRIIYVNVNNDYIGGLFTDVDLLANLDFTKELNHIVIDKEYYVAISKSHYSGFQVVSMIPRDELFSEIDYIKSFLIAICFILILISVLIALGISISITKPLRKLKEQMSKVQRGNLDVKSGIYNGEIGELGTVFDKMVNEIKDLIRQVEIQQKEKSDAELTALQAQISPHFIYNTLNTIKIMARMQGSKGIEDSLNSVIEILSFAVKTKSDIISIEEELIQLEYFIHIINLRYFESFNFILHIDEEVKSYGTLKYLLQTIIENAIYHGFNNKCNRGNIYIAITKEENQLKYLIIDNGVGIEGNKITYILSKEHSKHDNRFNKIGLYNVNKRIKATYGQQYGIQIRSKVGYYTRVEAIIPAVLYSQYTEQEKGEA